MVSVLTSLTKSSNEISDKFDSVYRIDLEEITNELNVSYKILMDLIDDNNRVSDFELQSILMYWAVLNSVVASLDLLRRGYTREPHIIMRHAIEHSAASYEICHDTKKFEVFKKNPDNFDSRKNIKVVKKVFPFFGQMYGELSNVFTHVSSMHITPHDIRDGQIAIGGMLDTGNLSIPTMSLAILNNTVDVIHALIELTFFYRINGARFWKDGGDGNCIYLPRKDTMDKIVSRDRKI